MKGGGRTRVQEESKGGRGFRKKRGEEGTNTVEVRLRGIENLELRLREWKAAGMRVEDGEG